MTGFTTTDNNYGVSKWIVNKTPGLGTHTTLGGALSVASAGDTVFMMPGTYTENNIMVPGVVVAAFESNYLTPSVIIKGTCTISTAGNYNFNGIDFSTNGANSILMSGSAVTTTQCNDCTFTCNGSDVAIGSTDASATLQSFKCLAHGTGSLYNVSADIALAFYYGELGESGANSESSGAVNFFHCTIGATVTSSSTGTLNAFHTYFTVGSGVPLTLSGTAAATLYDCQFNPGAGSACISVGSGCSASMYGGQLNQSGVTNCVSGAGTFSYSGAGVIGSQVVNINPTTQLPLALLAGNAVINGLACFPSLPAGNYNAKISDYFIGANTGSAHTITLLASPPTGQALVIKDVTGTASSFNVTIAGNGKNIDGSSSLVISSNYGAASLVYNGTQWNVIDNLGAGSSTTIGPYIVGPSSSDFATLAPAVAAAVAAGVSSVTPANIYIKPGTYAGTTLADGINLIGFGTNVNYAPGSEQQSAGAVPSIQLSVIINSTLTIPDFATVGLYNIVSNVASHANFTFTSTFFGFLVLSGCQIINDSNAIYTNVSGAANDTITMDQTLFATAQSSSAKLLGPMAGGTLYLTATDSVIDLEATNSIATCSQLNIEATNCSINLHPTLTLANSSLQLDGTNCNVYGTYTSATAGSNHFNFSWSTIGATINYSTSGSVLLTSCIASVATFTAPVPDLVGCFTAGNTGLNPGQWATTGTATNYVAKQTDYFIAVDSSGGARSVTLPAAPLVGQSYIVSDTTGSAAAQHITIIGNGANIDGSSTLVMSTAWQSAEIIFTGSVWKTV